ncbi:ribonuclease H family protein, partial [Roseinatronobacter sp.]|uniref:ribonuclease H family protein n=1 Tax=Roseinatronobacter sp. TaxID=1945755 RepID=UPI003F72D12E
NAPYRRTDALELDTSISQRQSDRTDTSGLTKLRKDEGALIIVRSDSRYLIDGMTKWRKGWEKRGWRKSDGKPVENQDLWERLYAAESGKRVRWEWVRGHSGDPANLEVDRIAREQAQRAKK